MHKLEIGLHSHPKGVFFFFFFGLFCFLKRMGSEPMLTPREKFHSTGGSEKGRIRVTASHRTASSTHYGLSYFGPDHVCTCDDEIGIGNL